MDENLIFLQNLVDQFNNKECVKIEASDIYRLKVLKNNYECLLEFDIRYLGDSIHDGIFITDGNGKVLYINNSYISMIGVKKEDILNKNVKDLEKNIFKNAVSLKVIKSKKKTNSIGKSLVTGTEMLISGSPVFDEKGAVSRVVVNQTDISQFSILKDKLVKANEKLAAAKQSEQKSKQETEYLRELSLKNQALVGQSHHINEIRLNIEKIANLNVTVLLTGETGVGKEVISDAIYESNAEKNKPYIKINCSAIPKELFESELFGYVAGAFTGANPKGKMGLIELGDKGTVLLDEIAEMPLSFQAKLLRVIQNKEIIRLGSSKPLHVNARFIAATNKDLKEMVGKDLFREDLYYRLNVFPIYVLSLRERKNDIPLLCNHFIKHFNSIYKKNVSLNSSVIELFKQHPWHGNIRELRSTIERLVIVFESDAIINSSQMANLLGIENSIEVETIDGKGFYSKVINFEKLLIEDALTKYKSTRKAAIALKMHQSTIVKKCKKYGISIINITQ